MRKREEKESERWREREKRKDNVCERKRKTYRDRNITDRRTQYNLVFIYNSALD